MQPNDNTCCLRSVTITNCRMFEYEHKYPGKRQIERLDAYFKFGINIELRAMNHFQS